MRLQRNLILSIIFLIAVFFIGVIGYKIIEKNWSVLDAVYMTAITLATVGYTDLGVSNTGRIFTIILIVVGISVFAYGISTAVAFVIEGQLTDVLKRRKMENQIEKLEKHCIICGAGDTGIHVIDEYIKMKMDFIVIERDSERLKRLLETREFLYIEGDATNDEVLIKSRIDKADGLVTALSDDKENLFVVLSARGLNPNLKIVSKAVESGVEEKLRKAGADEVIFPDVIGGLRIASIMLRPTVVDFLDIMLRHQGGTTRFGEATIRENSKLIGLSLVDANIQQQTGLLVLAIRSGYDGSFTYNPAPTTQLNQEDTLIVIGDVDQILKLKTLTNDQTV
jgi:voltage-gated potassium channel